MLHHIYRCRQSTNCHCTPGNKLMNAFRWRRASYVNPEMLGMGTKRTATFPTLGMLPCLSSSTLSHLSCYLYGSVIKKVRWSPTGALLNFKGLSFLFIVAFLNNWIILFIYYFFFLHVITSIKDFMRIISSVCVCEWFLFFLFPIKIIMSSVKYIISKGTNDDNQRKKKGAKGKKWRKKGRWTAKDKDLRSSTPLAVDSSRWATEVSGLWLSTIKCFWASCSCNLSKSFKMKLGHSRDFPYNVIKGVNFT